MLYAFPLSLPRFVVQKHTPPPLSIITQDEYCEPERNLEYWNTRPIVVTQRALEVGLRFGRWLLESRLAARGTTADLEAVRAAKLREVLIDLGPAFVKVGFFGG